MAFCSRAIALACIDKEVKGVIRDPVSDFNQCQVSRFVRRTFAFFIFHPNLLIDSFVMLLFIFPERYQIVCAAQSFFFLLDSFNCNRILFPFPLPCVSPASPCIAAIKILAALLVISSCEANFFFLDQASCAYFQ